MIGLLAVFGGAGAGALLRFGLGSWLNPVLPSLPLGTLAANLVGGLLVGLAGALLGQSTGVAPEWRMFVITGFLGGLTTFSTFSFEVVELIGRKQYAWALGTAGAHLFGSLLLTATGIVVAHALWTRA